MPKSIAAFARSAVLGLALLSAAPAAHAASLAGPYLAAMQADFRNDYVAASRYYGRALAGDPNNIGLIQNAVVTNVAAGQIAAALALADRLDAAMPGNQVAALVRIADAFANEDYERAETLTEAAPANELNTLLAGLVSGWAAVGDEAFPLALERFDALSGNEALEAYGQYHKALALAYAGDFVAAEAILAGSEGEPLHPDRSALIAHAEILAQIDREDEAIALLEQTIASGFAETTLVDLLRRGGPLFDRHPGRRRSRGRLSHPRARPEHRELGPLRARLRAPCGAYPAGPARGPAPRSRDPRAA